MARKKLTFLLIVALVLGIASGADALLIDRGGGMIYSTGMDITILQDANYAMTSGYDPDGLMTWNQANNWVQNLSYGGYSDWRLPTFDPGYNRANASIPAAADLSELAYLRYVELGPTYENSSDGQNFDPLPFLNLGVSGEEQIEPWYWSGTLDESTPNPDAWRFDFW